MDVIDITNQALTNSKVVRNRPSIASSVITTVPPSTPIPPQVPRRMKIGSLHLAWYINLIISCSNIPTDGTPMPWLTHNTGPTYDDRLRLFANEFGFFQFCVAVIHLIFNEFELGALITFKNYIQFRVHSRKYGKYLFCIDNILNIIDIYMVIVFSFVWIFVTSA